MRQLIALAILVGLCVGGWMFRDQIKALIVSHAQGDGKTEEPQAPPSPGPLTPGQTPNPSTPGTTPGTTPGGPQPGIIGPGLTPTPPGPVDASTPAIPGSIEPKNVDPF